MSEIWVLIIEHRHGQNVHVSATEPRAIQTLSEYVTEWWGDAATCGAGDMPENSTTAIELYFETVADESYSLESMAVDE